MGSGRGRFHGSLRSRSWVHCAWVCDDRTAWVFAGENGARGGGEDTRERRFGEGRTCIQGEKALELNCFFAEIFELLCNSNSKSYGPASQTTPQCCFKVPPINYDSIKFHLYGILIYSWGSDLDPAIAGKSRKLSNEVTPATRQATPATAKSWQTRLPLNDMPTFSRPSLLASSHSTEVPKLRSKALTQAGLLSSFLNSRLPDTGDPLRMFDSQTWLRLTAKLVPFTSYWV
jgi:hypothetical protein